jgi:hypothetical protein
MEKIKISKMSGKLFNIRAINTDTVTNNFCQKMRKCKSNICSECYSDNMLRTFRKNCRPAFQNNSDILSAKKPFKTPRIKDDIFRFSAHGELINQNHVTNIFSIIKQNPDTVFALWTKRPNLVNKYLSNNTKPKNIILIYSNPKLNTYAKLPLNFDKTFNVFTDNYIAENDININCGSKSCRNCMICYKLKNRTKIVNERVK